jgi:DNA polymerase III epsilon subunit-like protein
VLDYTAIDFETANAYRGSPCSVGLVKVRDGHAVDERHWLIRPPEPVDHFDAYNVALHHITPEMVQDAPPWRLALPAILDFIDDDVLVAHNAGFDIGVIRYACAVDNIEWPELRFLCTMAMSRRALSLPSYRLPFVAESCGFEMGEHHDALADAHGVVGVVRALAKDAGVSELADLAAANQMLVGHMSSGIYKGSVATGTGSRGFTPIEVNTDADPAGYLYGRVVVFTGTLMSMTRDIARQECARVGATPEQNTTKKTNILVIGDINPAVLRPGSNVTGKARKAFDLQDKGQEIEVMTEDDFVRCLEGKPLSEAADLLTDDLNSPTQPTSIASRMRKLPLSERPMPKPPAPPRPPRPLHRTPSPTDQVCSVEDCGRTAGVQDALEADLVPRTHHRDPATRRVASRRRIHAP